MSRDGAGTYNAPEAPVVTGAPISSSSYNTSLADIAAALTQSLSKDGQTVATANLPMGAFKHTGVGTATAANEYATLGQVQAGGAMWGGTAGGTADALTLTLSPALLAYSAGLEIVFIAASTNATGAPAVNVNGLGSKPIINALAGLNTVAGDIVAGTLVRIAYDGTNFRLLAPPAMPRNAGGPGTFQAVSSTDGGNWTLPAGGRWAYFTLGFTTATGAWNTQTTAGVAAGGTVIINSAGVTFTGFAWRVS